VVNPSDLDRIYRYIEDHLDETIESLKQYVRHSSVSVGDGTGMAECAKLVAERYRAFGCQEVEIVDTETFPGVFAYFDAGAPITLLNYNMYDVRSVGDRSAWTKEPFHPVIEPRGDIPAVMYGRGALVPKGPDTAWLAGLKAIKEVTGTLPVNIIFLAEGDEILGSVSYASLIERYRHRLTGLSGLIYLRATQNLRGEVPLVLGYKSFITVELRVSGKRWGRGPADQAAHSATRTLVDSPALRLCQLVASLYTKDGKIAVEGWLPHLAEEVVPTAEKPLVDALLERFAGKPWADVIPALSGPNVARLVDDLAGPEVLTRYIYGSALNIQGIYSGYTGPGSRTFTIPEVATARLDARLVTSAGPGVIIDALRKHLDDHGYSDVELNVLSAYPGSRTPHTAGLVQSFLRSVQKRGGKPVIWPGQAYGGPWSFLAQDYGVPVVFGAGIGHGGGVAMPDEYIVIDGGGKLNGLPEIACFAVDLVTDFATTARR
jgi:acetylornithine deacetylase/succinyl-diaminopimelate desuccinylase-like protein